MAQNIQLIATGSFVAKARQINGTYAAIVQKASGHGVAYKAGFPDRHKAYRYAKALAEQLAGTGTPLAA